MHKRVVYLVIICSLLFTACATYQSTTKNSNLNVSFIYNPGSTTIHPDYLVYNETDTSSKVFIKLKTREFIYTHDGENSFANIRVRFLLYNTTKNMALCDSGTYIYHVRYPTDNNDIIKSFDISSRDTFNYFLDVTVYDVNQDRGNQAFINIERSQRINSNDVIFLDKKNQPLFLPWVADTDTFHLELKKGLPKKWYVSWFPNKYTLRPAPYSLGNYNRLSIPKPDSTRVIELTDTSEFVLNRTGIMHFYQDTLKNGFCIKGFESTFPEVTTPINLLQPLRMLTSQKEFNDMNLLANKKEAVDKFWLDAGGNVNRARELIRVLYTRVMLSNQYFTSYTEGWKTDRGLIYIVFGLPVTIYKADNIERWIYGTSQSNKTLVFNFIRQSNPFSQNDYVLSRDEMYKISWTQAVDTWRNGKVYSVAY